MSRGRRAAPTELKILKGTQPCRVNASEPKPSKGRPTIPKDIKADPDAAAGWHEIVAAVEALGILTEVDGLAFANYATAYARKAKAMERIKEDGMFVRVNDVLRKHPGVDIARDAENQLLRIQLEYGLTASSRSKIHASNSEVDELDSFNSEFA